MTNEQAYEKACDLWGTDAWVEWSAPWDKTLLARPYRVGAGRMENMSWKNTHYGTGECWEEAFENAARPTRRK
ncbi:Uncharacterised protein [uncultured archaeon]|nr:Uncharacterised protein [uncultured archaeon]